MRLFGFGIHKERPGQISECPCWCIWHSCYLYTGDTLFQAVRNTIKYWKDYRALVG